MSNTDKENLTRLFEAFSDADSARQAARDIENGDKLFNAFPAPQLSDEAIEKVKARVSLALKRRRIVSIQWKVLSAAGVAAVIVIGILLSSKFTNPAVEARRPAIYTAGIPGRIWEGSDIIADDADFAVLAAEIETIKNTLAGVQVSDNDENGDSAVGDLEMELIEISGDIWKG
ncbi:MAG: hypothetical protein JW749_04595 [Sedimentisphaerales bacterium]|nr:hypothetical protein [Sedimentisphaerales bacterium]